MWGKVFSSMFEGSLIGKGAVVFAVWTYVITKTQNSTVTLNPKLVAHVIGCRIEEVEKAIELLCSPDPESNRQEEEGRRMVEESPRQYRVVNWAYYNTIRNEADRLEANREAAARYRERKNQEKSEKVMRQSRKNQHLPLEDSSMRALNRGDENLADKFSQPITQQDQPFDPIPTQPPEDCPAAL